MTEDSRLRLLDQNPAFRATFLQWLGDDTEERKTVLSLGRMLYTYALEYVRASSSDVIGGDLQAIGTDLRYLEASLLSVADMEIHDVLTAEEIRLVRFGGRLALRVGRIAEAIEKRLADRKPEEHR